ncbi:MAG: DUF4381 family protein [Chthoniobacterales bacterium]|nr:DUF4381 family protein [Chthoniobacterales bacterium]
MPPATNTPAPADLLPHEIAGPVWCLPYPMPVMIAAGVVALLLLAAAVWGLIAWRRRRNRRPLTAREKALVALAKAREQAAQTPPYEFSIEVCDVLRNFLAGEHQLPATTQTSYEFLQTARGSGIFDAERLAHLTRFLDKADMIKFARAAATGADNSELTELAEDLVKGGATDVVAA